MGPAYLARRRELVANLLSVFEAVFAGGAVGAADGAAGAGAGGGGGATGGASGGGGGGLPRVAVHDAVLLLDRFMSSGPALQDNLLVRAACVGGCERVSWSDPIPKKLRPRGLWAAAVWGVAVWGNWNP